MTTRKRKATQSSEATSDQLELPFIVMGYHAKTPRGRFTFSDSEVSEDGKVQTIRIPRALPEQ